MVSLQLRKKKEFFLSFIFILLCCCLIVFLFLFVKCWECKPGSISQIFIQPRNISMCMQFLKYVV